MSDHFITTWKTDNPGTSDSTSITIPIYPNETYNYDVDWDNDGVFDEFNISTGVTHDFGTTGTYTIRIRGVFPRIRFEFSGEKLKLLAVEQWGTPVWSSMYGAFDGCENLNVTASDVPDLSNCSQFFRMFRNCSSLIGTQAFDNWNMGNAFDLREMFEGATVFDQPIGSWDVSGVIWMSDMFHGASSFNRPIGNWDVSGVVRMNHLFDEASSFDQPLNGWDVANVTEMNSMFKRAWVFDQQIDSWDIGNVQEMELMFAETFAFDQPLDAWDVSSVSNMSGMFSASAFDQPLASWDMSNVENIGGMFYNNPDFDQDLGSWDISNVTNATDVLDYSGLSTANYDSVLIGWARLDPGETQVPLNMNFGAAGLTFCQGFAARDSLILVHGWTISDAGLDPSCTINPCPEDINGDGLVKYVGSANDRDLLLQFVGGSTPTNVVPCSGCQEDINDDGVVKYTGANNDRDLILQRIGGSVPTAVYICP